MPGNKAGRAPRYLFSGLLRCGVCGGSDNVKSGASVPFGMTGILSRWAFRNELFKKFQQISLDKPLV